MNSKSILFQTFLFGLLLFMFSSCGTNPDYYDLNDVVNGTLGTENDGKVAFKGISYVLRSCEYVQSTDYFAVESNYSTPPFIEVKISDVLQSNTVGNHNISSLSSIKVITDTANPDQFQEYPATGGVYDITEISNNFVRITFSIDTSAGSATGYFFGNYTTN